MVKQFTVNEWSVGSNPTMGAERMAEWSKAVDCKFTNPCIFIGSNPISFNVPFV